MSRGCLFAFLPSFFSLLSFFLSFVLLSLFLSFSSKSDSSPSPLSSYGRSLGSGPSLYLAQKTASSGRSVAGLILQSPLLSAYRVAFNFRFTLPGDRFPNVDRAPDVACPAFVIHGTVDEVVPFWHGQELFEALPTAWRAKPFWVEGAGHNNIESRLRETGMFVDCIAEFLDLHIPARTGRPEVPVEVPVCIDLALGEQERERERRQGRQQERQQMQMQTQ